MTPARRWSLAILLSAIAVHAAVLGFVALRTGSVDGYAFKSLDATEYFTLAANVVAHGTFSQRIGPPYDPDTWRTPGYPLFLAAIIAVFGPMASAAVIVQQMLSILNVWLLFTIARGYVSNRRAYVAATLFLLEPYHLYYATWLLATTWFTTWLLLTWCAWRLVMNRPTRGRVGVLGLCTGWLILIRPIALLIPLALGAGLLVTIRKYRRAELRRTASENANALSGSAPRVADSPAHDRSQRDTGRGEPEPVPTTVRKTSPCATWILLTCFVLSALLSPVVWMTRNKLVADHFALSHQGGIVLAYFKAAEVQLWRAGRTSDRYLETSLARDKRDAPHTVWDGIDGALCESLADAMHTPADQAVGFSRHDSSTPDRAAPSDGPLHNDNHGAERPLVQDDNDEQTLAMVHWFNIAQGNKTPYDSFVLSRLLRRIATRMFLDDPLSTLACCAVRSGVNLTFPLSLALRPPRGLTVHRIRSALIGLIYLALVGVALAKLIRARIPPAAAFFPVACTLALLIATTPQIDPRFRVPMIPLIALLAVWSPTKKEPLRDPTASGRESERR